ncbi:MAG: DUF4405 domain-containing protein [Dehalococcoidales bacterium]|nr:DUF4405 domain-containing protein [Dehalococcoidales bacterium]
MTKAGKYWILTVVLGILGFIEALTGFALWLGFPEGGSGAGRLYGGVSNLSFWGLTKHTWIDIHDWVAVALVALVLVHIVLHWKWIIRVGKNILTKGEKAIPVAVKSGN